MENSTLYGLLYRVIIREWKEEGEKQELPYFKKSEQEAKEALWGELSENGKARLNSYRISIENRMDCLFYFLQNKTLHLGIQIGMEIQSSLYSEEL